MGGLSMRELSRRRSCGVVEIRVFDCLILVGTGAQSHHSSVPGSHLVVRYGSQVAFTCRASISVPLKHAFMNERRAASRDKHVKAASVCEHSDNQTGTRLSDAPWYERCVEMAAWNGHANVVRWMCLSSVQLTGLLTTLVAKKCDLDTLRFVHERGAPLTDTVCAASIWSGLQMERRDIARWVVTHGAIVGDAVRIIAYAWLRRTCRPCTGTAFQQLAAGWHARLAQ